MVIRANHAVVRVFTNPWNTMNAMNTPTVWLLVGVYSKSVLIDTVARSNWAVYQSMHNTGVPQAKSVEADPATCPRRFSQPVNHPATATWCLGARY